MIKMKAGHRNNKAISGLMTNGHDNRTNQSQRLEEFALIKRRLAAIVKEAQSGRISREKKKV